MLLEEKLFYEKRDAKEEGREDERIRVIRAKLAKGKSVEEIADSLELDDEVVRKLVNDIQGME